MNEGKDDALIGPFDQTAPFEGKIAFLPQAFRLDNFDS
jgi:hypothetical protein